MHLVVRFSASIPDLPLTVSAPHETSGLTLKRLIRTHLPPLLSSNRIRLIYAGRVLSDTSPLSSRLPAPPPNDQTLAHRPDRSGKGKAPVRDAPPHTDIPSFSTGQDDPQKAPTPRIYIHCSVGDVLTPSELADETSAEQEAQSALAAASASTHQPSSPGAPDATASASPTPAAPQGFDRLLAAGFTAAEVASLRSQFQTVLSHTHTPDTMPMGNALRALEDRWLDTDSFGQGAGGGAGAGAGAAGRAGTGELLGEDEAGYLDDLFRGTVMGCFWPLGALVWGFREEGVWTQRKRIAVFTGIMINLAFGFVKLTS